MPRHPRTPLPVVEVDALFHTLEPRALLTTYTPATIAEYFNFPDDAPANLVAQGFSRDGSFVYGNSPTASIGFVASRDTFVVIPADDLPGNTMSAVSNQGLLAGNTAAMFNDDTSNPFFLDLAHPDEPRFLVDVIKHTVGPEVNIDDLVVLAFGPTGDALIKYASRAYILQGDTLTYLWDGVATDQAADGTVLGRDSNNHVATWTAAGGVVYPPNFELTDAWLFGPNGAIVAKDSHEDLVLRTGDDTRLLRGVNTGSPIGSDSAGRALSMTFVIQQVSDRGGTYTITTGTVQLIDTNGLPYKLASRVTGPAGDYGLTFSATFDPPLSTPRGFRYHYMLVDDGRVFTPSHVLTPVEGVGPFLADTDMTAAAAPVAPGVVAVNAEAMPFGLRSTGPSLWSGVAYPELDGAVVSAYHDPKDGGTYIIAFGRDIVLPGGDRPAGVVFRQLEDGTLADPRVILRDGADAIVSKLVVFVSADNRVHAVGTGPLGDVMMFYQTGQTLEDGTFEWSFDNITKNHLQPGGFADPGWVGPLTAYVAPWNGMNVAGLDAQGNIRVIWWAPGKTLWSADNLTLITGMPALAGSLTSYVTPWGGLNVAGIDGDGDLQVAWWVPGFGTQWRTNNMTEEFNGAKLTTAAAYVNAWGGLNIAGISTSGAPTVYWWTPGGPDAWISETIDIANKISSPTWDTVDPLVPVIRGDEQNLFGKTDTDQVLRLWWNPSLGPWELEFVTAS